MLCEVRVAPLYHFGNSLSRMKREVGVSLTPLSLRQLARSISRLSPILSVPLILFVVKTASFIFRPDRWLVALTSLHSFSRPSFIFGSSSLISRRRHCFSVSFPRLRPPGNIHNLSTRRRTRRARPLFDATSFEDLVILAAECCFSKKLISRQITRSSKKGPNEINPASAVDNFK
jgi:hypothetical protein